MVLVILYFSLQQNSAMLCTKIIEENEKHKPVLLTLWDALR